MASSDGPVKVNKRRFRYRREPWYRKIGFALEKVLTRYSLLDGYTVLAHDRERLVPPPVEERFPRRLAALGFTRHDDPISGEGWYITPPLRHVDAGPFLMGSDPEKDPDTQDNETPQHTVETASYWIGTYPVTVAEYDCAVRAGAVREPRYRLLTWTYQLQRLDDPVTSISWADATAYAAWLARLTGQPWRLPSEAEWEKAARGDDGRIYPWGDQWDDARADIDDGPNPVGAFAGHGDASPCGAHDLAGNVWEWTDGLLRPYPSYPVAEVRREADPDEPAPRVMRGGCFGNMAVCARTAYRNGNAPAEPDLGMGFRLVLSDA